jgi:hypothetical protein
MQSHSSRRRFLAAGSAATVIASLHAAIAHAEAPAPSMSTALAQAIERHKAAWAAFDPCETDAEMNAAAAVEHEAIWDLAVLPCGSVEDLLGKLRYLVEAERRLDSDLHLLVAFGSVGIAVDAHFNPADYVEEEA